VVFSPVIPFHAAGMGTDPPVSAPIAQGAIRAATEIAPRAATLMVADFRGKGHGDQERRTAHRLICATTAMDRFGTMTASCCSGILDRVDALLEDDQLRCMLEHLLGEATPMRQRPMTTPAVDPAATQQERQQLLAFATKIRCRLARSHKVTDPPRGLHRERTLR
jgi:hypothetical protein